MRFHEPVLLKEALALLNIEKKQKYIDATVGGGGHAEAMLKIGGQVLGIDRDREAVEQAKRHLNKACPNAFWRIVQGNFADLKAIGQKEGFSQVSGILFDLGPSNYQLLTSKRGFSFQKDAALDMRMDSGLAVTAADLLKVLSKKQLYVLFTEFVQERRAWAIANALVRRRQIKPIETTKELADLVVRVYSGGREKRGRLHPATKVFLALRMAVNSELENLRLVLAQAVEILAPKGRLVIISFHESEDRIVKHFLKGENKLQILTKKPNRPNSGELKINPRARSAKLRAAERKSNDQFN